MGDLLSSILKNARATAVLGAVICGAVAVGVYEPTEDVQAALNTFVVLGAGGAAGALVGLVVSRIAGTREP